jgi:hypothetical protein
VSIGQRAAPLRFAKAHYTILKQWADYQWGTTYNELTPTRWIV